MTLCRAIQRKLFRTATQRSLHLLWFFCQYFNLLMEITRISWISMIHFQTMYGFFKTAISLQLWILRSFHHNSILTRQTSEKVAHKPGLDYLLECFLSTFAPIISALHGKCKENGGNWGGLQTPPSLLPVSLAYMPMVMRSWRKQWTNYQAIERNV